MNPTVRIIDNAISEVVSSANELAVIRNRCQRKTQVDADMVALEQLLNTLQVVRKQFEIRTDAAQSPVDFPTPNLARKNHKASVTSSPSR